MRTMHMYVWRIRPLFVVFAQASSVDSARQMALRDIGEQDGSCSVRVEARNYVRDTQPEIYHRANAEFVVTDTAEVQEAEECCNRLRKLLRDRGVSDADIRLAEQGREVPLPVFPANRCRICGWPYAKSWQEGCVPGNCSQRLAPDHRADVGFAPEGVA